MSINNKLILIISNSHNILVQSPIVRSFQTSTVSRDIDSAAKFIGAGAATVGVAGSGMYLQKYIIVNYQRTFHMKDG